MATGTIYGSTTHARVEAKIVWTSTPSTANNTSEVTATLYYKLTSGASITDTLDWKIGIGSSSNQYGSINGNATVTITTSDWIKIGSHSNTVTHDTNGNASAYIRADGTMSESQGYATTDVEGTVTLDTIDRAASLTLVSCASTYFDGAFTYRYTVKSATVYHKLSVTVYNPISKTSVAIKTISIGKKLVSQITSTLSFTTTELSTIYRQLTQTTQGSLAFSLRTYSDSAYSTQIGETSAIGITLNIPNTTDTQPTVTMSLSPVSSLSSPFNELYIQGKSKVDANFSNGTAKYGATITSYSMSVSGVKYSSPYTSAWLTESGDFAVSGTVTDSRGFSRTYTETITVIPYSMPKILPASDESAIICARCDASGNLSDSGTYLKIKAKRSYSKVISFGAQKNFCSVRYRYRADTSASFSEWTTILATNSAVDEVETSALLGGTLLTTNTYVVEVGVVDTLGESAYITINIPTERVYMHRAGSLNSIGIGKYVEEQNMIDVADDLETRFRGKVTFTKNEWTSLGLNGGVTASTNQEVGRAGGGCYYRTGADSRHIYVAVNCLATGTDTPANANPLPSEFRPKYPVYAICAAGDGQGIAKISVSPDGNIYVHYTTSSSATWVDGYVDYWV